MEERDIKSYFEGVIENIDIILNNDFYKIDDKKKLIPVREDINKWYKDYIKNNTLKNIKPEIKKSHLAKVALLSAMKHS